METISRSLLYIISNINFKFALEIQQKVNNFNNFVVFLIHKHTYTEYNIKFNCTYFIYEFINFCHIKVEFSGLLCIQNKKNGFYFTLFINYNFFLLVLVVFKLKISKKYNRLVDLSEFFFFLKKLFVKI